MNDWFVIYLNLFACVLNVTIGILLRDPFNFALGTVNGCLALYLYKEIK